ncbi:MAG TPA: aldehyde ferredoxin oxidoreductase, partial [Firmicutes bacterium]|nr:aldehyde ferredoxin oxidoreductase [Candidatus Fermentithermobacillaceae bacterium]
RFMEDPVPSGPAKGKFIPRHKIDIMLDDYYTKRGWTLDGIPTKSKLEELGLEYAAETLEEAGYDLG